MWPFSESPAGLQTNHAPFGEAFLQVVTEIGPPAYCYANISPTSADFAIGWECSICPSLLVSVEGIVLGAALSHIHRQVFPFTAAQV